MGIKKHLEDRIYDMEMVAQAFKIDPFEIYFLGGSACVLGDYTDRATRDFDFVDLGYPSRLGKVFTLLRDFDLLEFQSTILSQDYKKRARKLDKFKYLDIYILSAEDIIVSKIIRLEEKDIDDIDRLIVHANKQLINQIINEVLLRKDLFEIKKEQFQRNLAIFKERYNV